MGAVDGGCPPWHSAPAASSGSHPAEPAAPSSGPLKALAARSLCGACKRQHNVRDSPWGTSLVATWQALKVPPDWCALPPHQYPLVRSPF